MAFLSRGAATLALLLIPALLYAAPGSSSARSSEMQQRWRAFLEQQEHQPAISARLPYLHCFQRAAAAQQLPTLLLLAVARGESDFDANAISKANAHGLMQIQWPGTANHLGIYRLADLYQPCRNVAAGGRYLKELLQRYDGDLHRALAAYNYGPSRITKEDAPIPDGADWYSRYIYRHLQSLLGRYAATTTSQRQTDFSSEQKLLLVEFNRPYRAEAMLAHLTARFPALHFDWFRTPALRFRVVVVIADEHAAKQALPLLKAAGFDSRDFSERHLTFKKKSRL